MIFCLLIDLALQYRNEIFNADLQQYAEEKTEGILKKAEVNHWDTKTVAANSIKLRQTISVMKGDKAVFEGRCKSVIEKTLRTIPEEERKDYNEMMVELKEYINE